MKKGIVRSSWTAKNGPMKRKQFVRLVIFPVINVVKPTRSPFAGRSIFFDEENYTCTEMLAQRSLPEISREMSGMNPRAGSVLMFAHAHYSTLVASAPLFYP
jgi:hypothetical protein